MPELAEVETARLLVSRHCVGKKITEVLALEAGGGPRDGLFDDIVLHNILSAETLVSRFLGKTLVSTSRKGKIQIWKLSGGQDATIHFGMTGAWSVKGLKGSEYVRYSVNTEIWPPKFTKLELVFSDGTRLALTDPRRLARFRLSNNALNESPVSDLAPDAYLDLPPLDRFISLIRQKSTAIKALLLDQNAVCSGIGNWIVDEVLYQSAIHPETRCDAVDDISLERLHKAIIYVIGLAVKVEAESDKFPKNWLFHYRWGKGKDDQKDAHGNSIKFETVGGRTSAVVAAIQGVAKKRPIEQKGTSGVAGGGKKEETDLKITSTGGGGKKKGKKEEADPKLTSTGGGGKKKGKKEEETDQTDLAVTTGVPSVISISAVTKKKSLKKTADEATKIVDTSREALAKQNESFPHHRPSQSEHDTVVEIPALVPPKKRARAVVKNSGNKRIKTSSST